MIQVALLTISDSVARGEREDRSGPELREKIETLGWSVRVHEVVPDDADVITARLRSIVSTGEAALILTTGGTGVALRDVTPEATRAVIERELPGMSELMRAEGRPQTLFSVLSRGVAGTAGRTLIVNLPGSPRGAVKSLETIQDLVPHIVDLLEGRTEHAG